MSNEEKVPYPFTAIPNRFFDEHMRLIKRANAKLAYLLILRRTVGGARRPREVPITLAEFRAFIGIAEDHTIEDALTELKEKGYIFVRQPGGPKSVKFYGPTTKVLQSVEKADASVKNTDRPDTFAPESVKNTEANLQKRQKGIGKNNRNPSGENTEAGQALTNHQSAPALLPTESNQEAKESVKEKIKEKGKESQDLPKANPGAPLVAPLVDMNNSEEEKKTTPVERGQDTMGRKATCQAAEGYALSTAEVEQQPASKAERWWQRVKEDMQLRLSSTAWRSMFEATKGLRLEGSILTVWVQTSAAKDALSGRYKREISNVLDGVARPGIEVRYTQEG